METKKEPGIAAVLSFFFPGAGHIYCGRVGFGILWFFLTALGSLLILPGIIMWVAGMVMANNEAKRVNMRVEMQQLRAPQAPQVHQTLGLPANESIRKMSPEAFANRFKKLNDLHLNGIINEDEMRQQKDKIIAELDAAIIDAPHDLLASFIELKQNGILDIQDIERIKRSLV